MEDQVAEAPRVKRRHLLVGGLGAAVAAMLGRTTKASAQTEPSPLLLGTTNVAPDETTVIFDRKGGTVLRAKNPSGGNALTAFSGFQEVPSGPENEAALWAFGAGDRPGSWARSEKGPGAIGVSDTFGGLFVAGNYGDLPPAGDIRAGVWSYSRDYAGAWNQSVIGPGTLGISETFGGLFVAGNYGDLPPAGDIRAGVWAYSRDYAGAWNQSVKGPGTLGISDQFGGLFVNGSYSNLPAAGDIRAGSWSYSAEHFGAWNQSQSGIGSFAQSGHIGVVGVAGGDYAEVADELAKEPAASHFVGLRGLPGLCARSDSVAVMGETMAAGGVAGHFMAEGGGMALMLMGMVQSDMAGNAAVPAGGKSVFVPQAGVTDKSHISLTFNGPVPAGFSYFVERLAGRGFELNVSQKVKDMLPFSFLVVEPGPSA